jgi:hypothetical protein
MECTVLKASFTARLSPRTRGLQTRRDFRQCTPASYQRRSSATRLLLTTHTSNSALSLHLYPSVRAPISTRVTLHSHSHFHSPSLVLTLPQAALEIRRSGASMRALPKTQYVRQWLPTHSSLAPLPYASALTVIDPDMMQFTHILSECVPYVCKWPLSYISLSFPTHTRYIARLHSGTLMYPVPQDGVRSDSHSPNIHNPTPHTRTLFFTPTPTAPPRPL